MIKYWASPSRAATLAILQLCSVANITQFFGQYNLFNDTPKGEITACQAARMLANSRYLYIQPTL